MTLHGSCQRTRCECGAPTYGNQLWQAHCAGGMGGSDPVAHHPGGSFQNALAMQMALVGSTNAAVHVIAMTRCAGVALSLDVLDAMSRRVPVIANLFTNGDKLMDDFYYAGGLPALLTVIRVECPNERHASWRLRASPLALERSRRASGLGAKR